MCEDSEGKVVWPELAIQTPHGRREEFDFHYLSSDKIIKKKIQETQGSKVSKRFIIWGREGAKGWGNVSIIIMLITWYCNQLIWMNFFHLNCFLLWFWQAESIQGTFVAGIHCMIQPRFPHLAHCSKSPHSRKESSLVSLYWIWNPLSFRMSFLPTVSQTPAID